MNSNLHKDALQNFANKTELERTISVGIQGPPELKPEEKIYYLGEFRERILISLTKAQVMQSNIFPEIIEALKDQRSTIMLIRGDIDYRFRDKYQKITIQNGKHYTVVHEPNLKGDLGLVIASDRAVDVGNISIKDET